MTDEKFGRADPQTQRVGPTFHLKSTHTLVLPYLPSSIATLLLRRDVYLF